MGMEGPEAINPTQEWIEKYKKISQDLESATDLDGVYDTFEKAGVQMSYIHGSESVAEPSTQEEKLKSLQRIWNGSNNPENPEHIALNEAMDVAIKKIESFGLKW